MKPMIPGKQPKLEDIATKRLSAAKYRMGVITEVLQHAQADFDETMTGNPSQACQDRLWKWNKRFNRRMNKKQKEQEAQT